MLKPIVSMNEMAMNESIATTCCYIWNGVSVAGTATLPHGGKLIQTRAASTYFLPFSDVQVSDGWLSVGITVKDPNLVNAHAYQSGGEWYVDSGALNPSVPVTMNGGWTLNTVENGGLYTNDLKDRIAIGNGKGYYVEKKGAASMTHIGATSAHNRYTAGNNWLADHIAYQYSS